MAIVEERLGVAKAAGFQALGISAHADQLVHDAIGAPPR